MVHESGVISPVSLSHFGTARSAIKRYIAECRALGKLGFPRSWLGCLCFLMISFAIRSVHALDGPAESRVEEVTTDRQSLLKQRDGLWRKANSLKDAEMFDEAISTAKQILAVERVLFGNAHQDLVRTLSWLSSSYWQLGDPIASKKPAEEAFAITKTLYGDADWRTIDARWRFEYYDKLAKTDAVMRQTMRNQEDRVDAAYKQGNFQEAIELSEQLAQNEARILEVGHPYYANSLIFQAKCYSQLKKHTDADRLYRQSLEIRKKALGEEHPDTGKSLNRLAIIYESMGDYANAETLYSQGLEIHNKVLGAKHTTTADSLDNLIDLYETIGNYEKADLLNRKYFAVGTTETRENLKGTPLDREMLRGQSVLLEQAAVEAQMKPDWKSAISLRERIAALAIRINGSFSDEALDSRRMVAETAEAGGDLTSAATIRAALVADCEKHYGEEHWRTVTCRCESDWTTRLSTLDDANRQTVLSARTQFRRAALSPFNDPELQINEMRRAFTTLKSTIGLDNTVTQECLRELGNIEASFDHIQTCLDQHRKLYGRRHPQTARVELQLGPQATGARKLFRSALRTLCRDQGLEHEDTLDGVDDYLAWLDSASILSLYACDWKRYHDMRLEAHALVKRHYVKVDWLVKETGLNVLQAERIAGLNEDSLATLGRAMKTLGRANEALSTFRPKRPGNLKFAREIEAALSEIESLTGPSEHTRYHYWMLLLLAEFEGNEQSVDRHCEQIMANVSQTMGKGHPAYIEALGYSLSSRHNQGTAAELPVDIKKQYDEMFSRLKNAGQVSDWKTGRTWFGRLLRSKHLSFQNVWQRWVVKFYAQLCQSHSKHKHGLRLLNNFANNESNEEWASLLESSGHYEAAFTKVLNEYMDAGQRHLEALELKRDESSFHIDLPSDDYVRTCRDPLRIGRKLLELSEHLGVGAAPTKQLLRDIQMSLEHSILTDDAFKTDSRSSLLATENVRWSPGGLEIPAGSSLKPRLDVGPIVEWSCDLTMIPDPSTGFAEVFLGLVDETGITVGLEIKAKGVEGTAAIISEKAGVLAVMQVVAETGKIREVPLPDGWKKGRWTLKYRYGHLEVLHDEKPLVAGYVESSDIADFVSLQIIQKHGMAKLSRIKLSAVPKRAFEFTQLSAGVQLAQGTVSGIVKYSMNNLRSFWRDAIKVRSAAEQLSSDYSPIRARTEMWCGRVLSNIDVDAAIAHSSRALGMSEAEMGPNHPWTARLCNDIGLFYLMQGDLISARPLLERALDIRRRTFGDNNKVIAESESAMGWYLYFVGDDVTAQKLLDHALQVRKSQLGDKHVDTLESIGHLAMLTLRRGDVARARELLQQGLDIAVSIRRRDFEAQFLLRLGFLEMHALNVQRAEELCKKAVEIIERTDPDGAGMSDALNMLGYALCLRGYRGIEDLTVAERAVDCIQRARDLTVRNDGPESFRVLQCSINLSVFFRLCGRDDDSLVEANRVSDVLLKLSRGVVGQSSDAESLAYVEMLRESRDLLLALRSSEIEREHPERLYDLIVQFRGLAARSWSSRSHNAATNPETVKTQHELRDVRRALAEAILSASGENQEDVDLQLAMSQQKERLQKQLSATGTAPPMAPTQQLLDSLSRVLPEKTAIVEFVFAESVMRDGNETGIQKQGFYLAFVLTRDSERQIVKVTVVPLGLAKPIHESIDQWLKELRNPRVETALRVENLIWKPISTHVADCTTVIVIPDGALTHVPWSALPGRRPGSFLIEDCSVVTADHLEAIDKLLRSSTPDSVNGQQQLLVVGGVDYQSNNRNKGSPGDTAVRRDWSALPGTLAEGKQVLELWKQIGSAHFLSNRDATEAVVTEELVKSRFVHLATHGFFAPPEPPRTGPTRLLHSGQFEMRQRNPFTMSGIVLSIGNRTTDTSASANDGFLTAEEVLALDLHKTELVVLSACDTAVGRMSVGEGVFGLQRAFQIAGAKSTLASLWSVDDTATQALMVEFYRNLWEKKLSKLEALRQAQMTMLKQYDPSTKTLVPRGAKFIDSPKDLPGSAPYYWAAFVLSGDWR